MRPSLRGHNALAFIPGVEEVEREEEKEEEGERKKEKEARKGGLGRGINLKRATAIYWRLFHCCSSDQLARQKRLPELRTTIWYQ